MSQPSPDIILEARGVTKRYPGTVALHAVDFRLYRSEVNVVIGENGAGKSTLMRLIAGIEVPDEGQLWLENAPVTIRSPREAAKHGIAIVHQELSIFSNLDLAENIFAGREPVRGALFLDAEAENRGSAEALRRLRKPLPVRTLASHFSLGCRQVVEIARSLEQRAKILILDEPTSGLSNREAESLFAVIDELKQAGVTIVYISHRLNELLHLGDRFTVLRSGRVVGETSRRDVSRRWIVERMSGRDIGDTVPDEPATRDSTLVLSVEQVTVAATPASGVESAVQEVSFVLRKGEILGIYGLLGSGRTELLESLIGLRPVSAGRLIFQGASVRFKSVAEAVRSGLYLIAEDRQRDGLIPGMSILQNITLGADSHAFIRRSEEVAQASELCKELNITARDLDLPVTALSGGNQQKVLIARALMHSPSLLLLDEPTRGVDVGAKSEIYSILRRLTRKGLTVIFTSSEIEETKALAGRALVLCQGQISAELKGQQINDEALFAAASPTVSVSLSQPSGCASA